MFILAIPNVAISLFYLCFWKYTFSTGAFSMNSFQDFNGKSYALVGPKSLNQWKSCCERDKKIMKCRRPFKITHKGKTMIFIKI